VFTLKQEEPKLKSSIPAAIGIDNFIKFMEEFLIGKQLPLSNPRRHEILEPLPVLRLQNRLHAARYHKLHRVSSGRHPTVE